MCIMRYIWLSMIKHREILWVNKISLHLRCHVIITHQHHHRHEPTVYDDDDDDATEVQYVGWYRSEWTCHNNHGWINENNLFTVTIDNSMTEWKHVTTTMDEQQQQQQQQQKHNTKFRQKYDVITTATRGRRNKTTTSGRARQHTHTRAVKKKRTGRDGTGEGNGLLTTVLRTRKRNTRRDL